MSEDKKRISILGSTGSIGTQALEVVDKLRDKFEIVGLSAGKNIDLIREQIKKFHPKFVCVATEEDRNTLKSEFPNLEIMSEKRV